MAPFLLLLFFFFTQGLVLSTTQPSNPKTFIFRINSETKPSVFPTHYHWYSSEFAEPTSILHVYQNVFHGFSAYLTQDQVSSISTHPSVLSVFEDRRRSLHTTRSPQFLGLRTQRGLWSESDYGSDVIIGIFDTGIWPEHRSFSDLNLGPIPRRWKGVCDTGVKFTTKNCNKKLIGARYFSKGQQAGSSSLGPMNPINDTVEFRSPRDADGHGTHTASTAAGRYAFKASMSGYASGIAKGVAPKARLAVYKVCWKGLGCFDSDILAAFDAAVSDGVDVISLSIGGGEGVVSPFYLDPIAIGSYGAVSRGVFVATSAGNDGPSGMSVTNSAPWLTTVGAGTIDRDFPAEVILGDGRKLSGVSLYSGKPLNAKMFQLVYPGKSGLLVDSLCMENSLDPNIVKGKIVVCDRGSSPRVVKGLVVKKAGGIGMILTNDVSNGEGVVGDPHILPACALGADEGVAIKSYIKSSANPTATINFKGTMLGIKPAPVVASFSARGPSGLNPEILKPDLIAPGVNILAAWTNAVGPSGLDADTRRTEFNILSGTSMACPHVSGAAALLKSAHPDWSPAAIRSALMTTATIGDNRNQPMIDEASRNASTPYDFGSGNLNLGLAMDPGLVYDMSANDYVNYMCSIGYVENEIQVITRIPVKCPARKALPENLNYPSFVALFQSPAKGVSRKTFIRTVTNVGAVNSVYRVKVETQPKGVSVSVEPSELVFSESVKKLRFVLTVTAETRNVVMGPSGAAFGSVSWTDGKHVVRSPIVITQVVPL
ncbi:hypothetical protein QN277_001626 [Acacia crassicarpa]|uniref:Subtilisin-like protease SBT1.6 n=1 Tax=Acacia crassicarpa TaxID=499986 RepID=A0AAE1N7P8_9FABA|nr:hypothetical protein QN277_001626 [Acacia crassicarpa]